MKMMLKNAVFVTAGLSALLSAGCSSGSDTTTTAAPPSATGSASGAAAAQGRATNLAVTAGVRTLLGDAYYEATTREPASGDRRDKVIGPEHVRYGKIAGSGSAQDVFYAMGDTGFTGDPISRQDGPHVWRKRGGTGWEYLGDTGGDFCGKVPRELVRAWGESCP